MKKLLAMILLFTQISLAWEIPKGLMIKFGGLTPALDLETRAPETGATDIKYKPSTQAKTFLAFDYKNLGASISAYNPRDSDFRRKFGNGQFFDLQLRATRNEYYLESYFQSYKGYYLENASKVMTSPFGSEGQYPQNSSLKAQHYGVQIFQFHHPEKFSPRKAIEFVDPSTESGGSWYYSAALNSHQVFTKESLVPATAIDNYGSLSDLKNIQSFTAAVGAGGGYSLVIAPNSWVLSGMLGFAVGPQWASAKYTNDRENRNQLSVKTQIKLAAGYSGEQFVSGINLQYDTTQIRLKSSELGLSSLESAFFIGYRF
jgi:hypothetical protein